MLDALLMLVSAVFSCLAVWSARETVKLNSETRNLMRDARSRLAELELMAEKSGGNLRKLTATVSAMGRWANPKLQAVTDNGLPDPASDPEKWRAAVRARSPNISKLNGAK